MAEVVEYRLPSSEVLKERISRLLAVAKEFAQDTDTEADDKAVEAVDKLVNGSPFLWEVAYRFITRRLPLDVPKDVSPEMELDNILTELHAKRDGRAEAIDPATIILAVQVLLPLLENVWAFMRKRRNPTPTPPAPTPATDVV